MTSELRLDRTVLRVLRDSCGLEKGARVVVGISGGADSLTLLHVLHRLGYAVVAAHFHHGLRAAADSDALTVKAFAESLGVPFVLERGRVAEQAAVTRQSLEAAAREARYRFLFTAARQWKAGAVAVGHTSDDQAETVLMHILRGSGMAGLAGLRPCRLLPEWDAGVRLARPLLKVGRLATAAYAVEYHLPVRWDASNWERTFLRNRLRLEILPRLRLENPRLDAALGRLAATAAEEEDFMAAEALRRLPDVLAGSGAGYVAFHREAFRRAHVALQRRWLRWAAQQLGAENAAFDHIERALQEIGRPGGFPRIWFAGLWLWVEPNFVWISYSQSALPATLPANSWPQLPDLPDEDACGLQFGESLPLQNGWRLEISLPQNPPRPLAAAPFEAWCDADAVRPPLTVRPRRAGERIAPLGMGGHRQKLSDLMTNAKIPQRLRARWPVVLSGEMVVWVPFLALSHFARVTTATRAAVHCQLRRN